jgi:nitrile hydratase accessory protein
VKDDGTDDVADMDGPAAVPRDNGEIVFAAPWEARAFALAVGVVQRLHLPWDEFRLLLVEEIALDPDRPYYESWACALESLIVGLGLTTRDALDGATPSERAAL